MEQNEEIVIGKCNSLARNPKDKPVQLYMYVCVYYRKSRKLGLNFIEKKKK